MNSIRRTALLVAAMALSLSAAAQAQGDIGYDPEADPFAQLEDARLNAAESDRHILLIAGGDWCSWCHYLDAFLKEHEPIYDAFNTTFVVTKIYMGDKNDNKEFFATLPEAIGYPHFWILSSGGEVLQSQNTLPLEDGDKSYDPIVFSDFIQEWRETPAD